MITAAWYSTTVLPPLKYVFWPTSLHYITLHYRYFIRHLHLKWPVVLQQSYVYASVNRWVFSCLLKVHVSVSSWRAEWRSFHSLDFFGNSLDDSHTSYLIQVSGPCLNDFQLSVIRNRPSKVAIDRTSIIIKYYSEEMKVRGSSVQSNKPHRTLATHSDLNRGPPSPQTTSTSTYHFTHDPTRLSPKFIVAPRHVNSSAEWWLNNSDGSIFLRAAQSHPKIFFYFFLSSMSKYITITLRLCSFNIINWIILKQFRRP